MFHARCKISNIVRKIFFRYNLLLLPIKIRKKMFPLIYNLYLTLRVFLSVNFGNHRAAPITREHSGSTHIGEKGNELEFLLSTSDGAIVATDVVFKLL